MQPLDRLFFYFIRNLGISSSQAFVDFNFTPPILRRNIAILGLIHKRVLGLAHEDFNELWPFAEPRAFQSRLNPRHDKQLQTEFHGCNFRSLLFRRSIFGAIHVYNKLPQSFVDCTSVSAFQSLLNDHARHQCQRNFEGWDELYSPSVLAS